MEVIQQAPFMPLTKALHEAIKSMNESKQTATQESIAKFLRENYQYVHIPSMNIIYDCLGLLIKERMIYHTGNGYFINTHNRAGKSAETSNAANESSVNNENDSEVLTKKRTVSESPGNSKKNNREKLIQTGDRRSQKHTKSVLDANGKALDKKHSKESEQTAFSPKSHTRCGTESEQTTSKHSKSTKPSAPFSNSDKAGKEQKQQTDASSGQSESSGSQSEEGRLKRGFLGRMSARRVKVEKNISAEEETKGPKEKKGVLNQLACFIRNRSQSSAGASGSSANTIEQSVMEENHDQISQSCSPHEQINQSYTRNEQNVSFLKDENSPARNFPAQTQRDVSVTRTQYDEESEGTNPTFTRSRSFVTTSRKRPSEVARSNSFTSSRTNKRQEQTVLSNRDHENISYCAWKSSVSAPHKGPCAVGVVRPLSQQTGPQSGHAQRRPQSASSSGRSSSLKVTTRPYSVPHAADLSPESWSKLSKGDREIARSKSFGNTQKERNVFPEKSSRMGERKPNPGIMPPQNYNAYSNNRLSLNGSRMRTVPVPINGKYGNSPNTNNKKISPRVPAHHKQTPVEKRNLETSVGEYSQHAHAYCTDVYCTSPICNDKSRINELKPINCKCNEHEEGLAGDACENKSESNHVSNLRQFEKVFQNDVSCLTKRIDSADICLDEVSSTSGSEFAAEMKHEDQQSAYILRRTAPGQACAEQTPYCASYQFTPEETKINSSLTFIGII